jgi:hypothetical protein
MEKFINITTIFDSEGNESIDFKSSGYNEFEVIGLLTYYRDQIEVTCMHKKKSKNIDSQTQNKRE